MNYAQIRPYDVANGEGIRTSLFVSGCKFKCKNCFNEEYQDFNYGTEFTMETVREILSYIERDEVSGLSILGGDPLWQDYDGLSYLLYLCIKVRKLNKTVWLWSGFTYEKIMEYPIENYILNCSRQALIKNIDIWVDGQFEQDKRDLTLQFRGSSNQRIIDVQKSLKNDEIILWKNGEYK